MNNLKRVAIFLLIFAAAVVVSVSFSGNDIQSRAIVLGVGVDAAENGLRVTVEVVSPSGKDEANFVKTISANGQTVAEAFRRISEKCGKEVSLGQCVLLVLGEEFCTTDFSSTVQYFVLSDSFRESAAVCCCRGSAEALLQKGDVLGQSVSIALADKLNGLGKDVGVPSCNLLKFARSQTELFRTGFLNFVLFETSPNTDPALPDVPQGCFVCERVAAFRSNRLVGVLDRDETLGFAVLSKVDGNTFVAADEDGVLLTLRVNSKSVDISQDNFAVEISVKMQVKLARTDSFGAGGSFNAKTRNEIPPKMLDEAKRQATDAALKFLQKQRDWDVDLLNFHESFRQKFGTTAQVVGLPMSDITVVLKISVEEK